MPQAIPAIASIGGALLGNRAAGKAADAQRSAAVADRAFQTETRDLIFDRLQPFYRGGQQAQRALDFELGLGARPTFGGNTPKIESFYEGGQPGGGAASGNFLNGMIGGGNGQAPVATGAGRGVERFRVGGQTFNTREEAEAYAKANATPGREYGGYTKTPGYDFRMTQGLDALESSAAARGGLYSGAALQASQQFGQDYATSEYENYLAKLSNRAGVGMGAATGQANAATNAASGVSNALAGAGNAAAAGAIGQGNALVGGLQNLATNWNYQKQMGNNFWGNPMQSGGSSAPPGNPFY